MTKKKRYYKYSSLILEGRQLEIGETGCLPAKEVVRKILDADFPECGLKLYDDESKEYFDYEFDKMPSDGKFLLKVTRKTDNLSLRVFIDTRTKPNYIWVEKLERNDFETINKQILNSVKNALKHDVYKAGWEIKITKFVAGEPKDEYLLGSALDYATPEDEDIKINKEAFRAVVTSYFIADEVMNRVLFFMKGKKKPQLLIAPLKAAYMAGAIHRLTRTNFKAIFGNLLGSSLSSVDTYMSDDYIWNPKDQSFKQMIEIFKSIVDEIKKMRK